MRWLVIFVLIFLFPAVLSGNQGHSPAAGGTVGVVTKIRGEVTARKTGDEKNAVLRVGDRIAVGQIIHAATGAAVQLVLTDDSVIHVLPGTTLQIGQYSYSLQDHRRSAVIKLTAGAARFILHKLRNRESRFTVVTDQARIGVGIADFIVTASGKETEVANLGPALSVVSITPYIIGRVYVKTNQRSVVEEKMPPALPTTITPEQRRRYLVNAEI